MKAPKIQKYRPDGLQIVKALHHLQQQPRGYTFKPVTAFQKMIAEEYATKYNALSYDSETGVFTKIGKQYSYE